MRGLADEQGFTLIEVLVAATLLVAGVLATLSLLDNATRTTGVSKQRDVANAVAQEMVERAAGGRYTLTRNDLTDVDTAAARPGPADRLRVAMDPDGDQASGAVTPATPTSGTLPLNTAQSWTLRRKNTTYTVSYRACTGSDTYQQVQIAGPFDCNRPTSNPSAGNGDATTTAGGCSLGVAPTSNAGNPGALTVHLQVLGISGLSLCMDTVGSPLFSAVCTLLGTSVSLSSIQQSLLGAGGLLTNMLGGLVGGSVGCTQQVEQVAAGARNGIGTSTKLVVTVSWTDRRRRAHSITQSSLIRRGTT
jgi:prepilin-type N-terminal cleavage/methylation domain-containing protein